MEKLTIIEGGEERKIELDIDEITVGRAPENIIQIAEKRASRQHCRITKSESGFLVTDLETSNGTRINGLKVEGAVAIQPGDELQIGDLVIRFGEKPAFDEFAPTLPDPSASPAPAVEPRKKTSRKRRRSPSGVAPDGEIDLERAGDRFLKSVQKNAVVLFLGFVVLVGLAFGVPAVLRHFKHQELVLAYAGVVKAAEGAQTIDELRKAADQLKLFLARAEEAGFGDPFGKLAGDRIKTLVARKDHLERAEHDLDIARQSKKVLSEKATVYYSRLLRLRERYADTPTADAIEGELKQVRQDLREELAQRLAETKAEVLEHLKALAYQKAGQTIDRVGADLGQGALAADEILSEFRLKLEGVRALVRSAMKKDYESLVQAVQESLAVSNYAQARKTLSGAVERFADTPYAFNLQRDLEAIRLMAGRRVTSFEEARKISEGRSQYLEKLQKARDLMAKGEYLKAKDVLDEVARAGGEVGPEFAQRSADIQRILDLRDKLITQINRGGLKDKGYELAGQKLTIVGADRQKVELRFVSNPGTTAHKWQTMAPVDQLGYFRRMELEAADWETIGIFSFLHGLVDDGHRALIEAIKNNPASRAQVFELFARLTDTPQPPEGFVIYAQRIMTPRERDMKVCQEEAERLAYGMTKSAQKDEAYRKFQKLLEEAGEKFGASFARDLKAKVIADLASERQRLLAALKNDAGLGNVNQLRALKEELNRRRAHALKLIYDEKEYPYDACHGCKAQPEVDRRVNAVKEIWDNPFSTGFVAGGVKKATDRIKEINGQLKGLGLEETDGGMDLEYVSGLANKKMDIKNFGLSGKEQNDIAHNNKQMADNEAAKGVPSSAEKKQVEITNKYRIMMGHRAVRIDDKLTQAARGHSQYMQSSQKFAHVIPGHPDGADPTARVKKAGYAGGASENISMGRTGPAEVHDAWYRSSGHHRNLLHPNHRAMGAGQAGAYWTQNFGSQ